MANGAQTSTLRYLEAEQVKHPLGTLAGLNMFTEENEKLGSVEGVLVEPAARRIRYFVLERSGIFQNRRYLLDADRPASIEAAGGKLRVMANEDDLERFDRRSVQTYSAEDAVDAMFARPQR